MMKKNCKGKELISIVIPMYNASVYVVDCLNMIGQQTYRNLDIIVVDDGSKDETYNICLKCAKQDKRISVLHQENKGVSAARNIGIRAAKGNYTVFMDCDDYISEQYIEHLYEVLIKNESDLSVCSCLKIYENKEKRFLQEDRYSKILTFTQKEAVEDLLYRRNITGYPFAKLIRTDIVKKIMFQENLAYREDRWFVFQILGECNKIAYSSKILYLYVQQKNSATHKVDMNKYKRDWYQVTEQILKETLLKYPDIYSAAVADEFIYTLDSLSKVIIKKEHNYFRRQLYNFLKINRQIVFNDVNCKMFNRILAFLCCINISFTGFLCMSFCWLKDKFRFKIRRSI